MESLGERIARLRTAKGWKRPELGRRMGSAINRKPYSGEAVRRYEADIDEPGNDARKALAAVFDTSEAYIEFGPQKAQPAKATKNGADISPEARDVALAWMRLTPTRQHVIREWVFLESVLAEHYPWLLPGRPSGQSYNDYERAVENDLVRITKRLMMKSGK